MQNNRIVYGYTYRPFHNTTNEHGKIDKGLIRVLFEEIDGVIRPINEEVFFDEKNEVFIHDGFESIEDKYMQRLVKITAIPNTQADREGHTQYVTFKSNLSELGKNTLTSIIECPLPDALSPYISLPNPPRTNPFYLLSDDNVYGPFKLERDHSNGKENSSTSGKLIPLNGRTNNVSIPPGFINQYKYEDVSSSLNDSIYHIDGEIFLSEPMNINKLNKSQVEFTTPDVVISALSSMSEKRIISSQVVTAIKKQLSKTKLGEIAKETIKKVIEDASKENKSWRDNLFDVIKNDPEGKSLIDQSVSEQKEFYIKQWRSDAEKHFDELSKRKATLESDNEKLLQDKSKLERTIEQKEQEIQEKIAQLGDQSGLEAELAKKRLEADKQLEAKRIELAELETRYGDLKEIADLERKKDLAREMYIAEQGHITKLEETRESIQEELKKAEGELQRKLREMVPYITSIIQAPMPTNQDTYSLADQNLDIITTGDRQDVIYEVVNSICNTFHKAHGRDYSPSLIASVLVAIHQNFMTMLSGPPGLGKTSFIRILQDILGLKDRFKEVPVGRTWTSEREFIGFYNSLNDNYSPAPSGVYQYLKGIEADDESTSTTHLILLDEANLSPMEHYAAVLLNASDKESAKTIMLGKDTVQLPKSLRIVGTVNHDMTTEPLSARLLDRSAIIPFDMDFELDDTTFADVSGSLCFSHNDYAKLFGRESSISEDNISIEPIEDLINILSDKESSMGIPFIISKRKREVIRNYIRTLTPVLQAASSLTYEPAITKAYDYATLYFILPPLSGNGPGLEKRLNQLLDAINDLGLQKSARKVEDMISRGKHHLDTFNFFNY